MAAVVRTVLTLFVFALAALRSLAAPSGDHEGMVVEDISEILRGEGRYARCPPQKILIGSRCRQILSEEELRKVSMLDDYSDCVRKNVEDHGGDVAGGRNGTRPAVDLAQIHSYCMTMCMLRAEGL